MAQKAVVTAGAATEHAEASQLAEEALTKLTELVKSATEQPNLAMDWDMDSSLAVPAEPTVSSGPQSKWEIQVSFNNDMWWAMPHDLSDPILDEWKKGAQEVSFVWDWGKTRKGSYRPDGAETSHNRYIIDFDVMQQRNIDNDRTRTVKVVAVLR